MVGAACCLRGGPQALVPLDLPHFDTLQRLDAIALRRLCHTCQRR